MQTTTALSAVRPLVAGIEPTADPKRATWHIEHTAGRSVCGQQLHRVLVGPADRVPLGQRCGHPRCAERWPDPWPTLPGLEGLGR